MDPNLWELIDDGNADDEVPAIIRLPLDAPTPPSIRLIARFGEIGTCRLLRGNLRDTREIENVISLKAPTWIISDEEPDFDISEASFSAYYEWNDERRPENLSATGRGVVIGIVDWGFDFAHSDFRTEDGSTRILALWDQRSTTRDDQTPQPYGYGTVHTAEAINHALTTGAPYAELDYDPADADVGRGAHGTHVASIAAGNGRGGGPVGLAPEADLVLVHLSNWKQQRPVRLGDSVTLLEAVDFITKTAANRPCVINLSMGRHAQQHDGTTLVEQALDSILASTPNTAIIQSAGNYFAKDTHASGTLRPGQKQTLIWDVAQADTTPNEMEIWYSSRDTFVFDVFAPNGERLAQVRKGQSQPIIVDGRTVGSIYHRINDPNCLDHLGQIFLYPEAPPGLWEIQLVGEDVIVGDYHAWIERDATCPGCQSRFAPEIADPTHTTGSICNGFRTIAVGAYNAHSPDQEVAPFSSCGRTRDHRIKPDLCAPGVFVLAARSAPHDSDNHADHLTRLSGTSMASPHVAGTVALMFQVARRPLRIEETRNLLLSSVRRVGPEVGLSDQIGSGYLQTEQAVAAVEQYGIDLGIHSTEVPVMSHDMPDTNQITPSSEMQSPEDDRLEQEVDIDEVELERDDGLDDSALFEDDIDSEDIFGDGPILGRLRLRSGSRQDRVRANSATPIFRAASLDDALQHSLSLWQGDIHTVIVGNILTGTEYRVYRWDIPMSLISPLVVEFDAAEEVALLVLNGRTVYMPSDPLTPTTRWVQLPRAADFYALAPRDQNRQRRRWVRALRNANPAITIPGVTVNETWLNGRSMPALRILLAHFRTQVFRVRNVNQPDRHFRGASMRGATFPIIKIPIVEPTCYMAVIAHAEGLMETINAYDLGAGISIGSIQLTSINAFVFRFLWRVWQEDRDLFRQAFNTLNWTMSEHDGHPDLIVNAGEANEIRLHGSHLDTDRTRNVGYLHSGTPGNDSFSQIVQAFRRTLTERFRELVVWPHIHELIVEITEEYLRPGLNVIHDPANGIPPLDRRNPDRDTFILKAILLSTHVRYNACLRPFLRALRAWPTPAEKLAHWRDALNDTAISWGNCNNNRRGLLLNHRLPDQEQQGGNVFNMIQRAMAARQAPEGDFVETWTEWEDESGIDISLDDSVSFEAYPDEADILLEVGESVLPATGAFSSPFPALFDAVGEELPDIFRVASANDVYNALVYRTALTEQVAPYFEIVAYPNTQLAEDLQAGDILLRRGDGAHTHTAMLADGALVHLTRADLEFVNSEPANDGFFARVVEGGAFPHAATDEFFRRITDESQRIGGNQVLVRLNLSRPGESDMLAEIVPSNGLSWPGATPDQLAFMRQVYDAQVRRAIRRGGTFVGDVPASELARVQGVRGRFLLRTAAAESATRLFADANQALVNETAAGNAAARRVTRIGLTSAYRSASHQFALWQRSGYFPRYYAETQAQRRALPGGEHGVEAVRFMVTYVGRRIAAPGFSNHNNGLAMDLLNIENNATVRNRSDPELTRLWRQTWFYQWMNANAARYGFHENTRIDEPWHWEYRPASLTSTDAIASIATEEADAIDWCRMRQSIVNIARAEERHWTQANGTKFLESHPSMLPRLQAYWRTVPGFGTAAAANRAAHGSATNHRDYPWSAAFICFVMHTAGIRRAHGFEFGQRHIIYIVGALRNREQSDRNRVFWLVDEIEAQLEAIPQPGDLICFNRRNSRGVMSTHSYSSLRNQFGSNTVVPTGVSHCSLVVGTVERNGRRFLQTIGGNESDSVRSQANIPLNASGGIDNPRAHNIFGVIKLIRC